MVIYRAAVECSETSPITTWCRTHVLLQIGFSFLRFGGQLGRIKYDSGLKVGRLALSSNETIRGGSCGRRKSLHIVQCLAQLFAVTCARAIASK